MKAFKTALPMAALMMCIGCNESTPGGSGVTTAPKSSESTTTTANRPTYGEAEGTFDLNTPVLATRMKQGETKSTTIGLNRGKNFEENVTLRFSDLPQGISIEPATPTIANGEREAKIHFHAADDASIGEFTVKVLGQPAKGADATSQLQLIVSEK